MIILKEQHPNAHACAPLNDGLHRYFEVYITPQNNNNDIINQGLIFKEANLGAYPRSSLDDTANLKPNHSSLLPKKEVISGLQRNLAVFGEIINIGITTKSATGFFMGSGYAVLNIQQATEKFLRQQKTRKKKKKKRDYGLRVINNLTKPMA